MLSFFIYLLLLGNVAVLIFASFGFFSKWLKWTLPVLALTAVLHLLVDGFYQPMIPAYGVTAILIAVGLYRWKKNPGSAKGFLLRSWAVLWRLICVLCLAISVVSTWYFGRSHIFMSSLFSPTSHESDFTGLGWSEAFSEMKRLLEKEYAFGEWKSVDWDTLNAEYSGRIAAAEESGDEVAYYRALRECALSLPDGHVSIQGNDFGLPKTIAGGGFGFTPVRLDDGRVVVSVIEEDCPAKAAGMEWGAEIIRWNGMPVQAAIDQVPLRWVTATSCATTESRDITKTLYLCHAPMGSSVPVVYRNADESVARETTLTAYDDSFSTFLDAQLLGYPWSDRYVEWSVLPGGYGYLRISGEIPALSLLNPVGEVRRAVKAFVDADVPGVILDLRVNFGGIDDMAPLMMSFFADEPMFYERQAYRNRETGKFESIGDITLDPSSPHYSGPVAMLISNNTGSTGEGFPFIMESLGLGPVVGFYGTNGSFGMAEGRVRMPGGYLVHYPNGAALDEEGNILLDSDGTLQGGVLPGIRVPLDMEALEAIYIDGRDYLLERAVASLERE